MKELKVYRWGVCNIILQRERQRQTDRQTDIPWGTPYKKDRDACREISNEPLKGTNLGVA